MSLAKTEKGRQALQARDPALSPRERQILVLCNGSKPAEAFVELMGAAVEQELHRLISEGYLAVHAAQSSRAKTGNMNVGGVQRAPEAVAPVAAQMKASTSPEPQQQSRSRRSLGGTKMYIIDMLQLMRDMEAASLTVNVHTSSGEVEFMSNVLDAVRFIGRKSGATYASRVLTKLSEIVPEPYLPHIEEVFRELQEYED